MKHDMQDQKHLEQFVDRLCKQQPLRKAPVDLHQRVMRELQLRKVLPWWRKSFIHWPMLFQLLFVVAALITAKLALLTGDWISTHWISSATAAAQSLPLVQSASTALTVSTRVSAYLVNMVPASLVYGTVLVIAALYLVLFGIGVTTYKTLYASR